MLTKSEKSNVKYQVNFVKHEPLNGKIVTKFAIHDQVRGLRDEFITYWVTVFEDLAIENGDFIRLLDFDNLVASYYPEKKKITHFISAVVEVIKKDKPVEDAPKGFENPFESR